MLGLKRGLFYHIKHNTKGFETEDCGSYCQKAVFQFKRSFWLFGTDEDVDPVLLHEFYRIGILQNRISLETFNGNICTFSPKEKISSLHAAMTI